MEEEQASAELEAIIAALEKQLLPGSARFSIRQYGGGPDESFIYADREGLKRFALELLKAAKSQSQPTSTQPGKLFSLDIEEEWLQQDGDTCVHYIEPAVKEEGQLVPVKKRFDFAGWFFPTGCLGLFIILVIATIIGIRQLVLWLF